MKCDTKWSIDRANSEIAFNVKHKIVVNIKGTFNNFDATIYTSDMDFTKVTIELWIDPASINTGDEERDERLKNADFFFVKKHKQITFTSNTIKQADEEGNHEMFGELSIKGITKTIKLNVVFKGAVQGDDGNERAGFLITGKINRKDWELNWNNALQSGGEMIGEEVSINCTVQLMNTAKKVAAINFERWMDDNL